MDVFHETQYHYKNTQILMIHTQAESRPLPENFSKTVKLCRTRVCFVGTETLKNYQSVKKMGKHKKRQCFCEKKNSENS